MPMGVRQKMPPRFLTEVSQPGRYMSLPGDGQMSASAQQCQHSKLEMAAKSCKAASKRHKYFTVVVARTCKQCDKAEAELAAHCTQQSGRGAQSQA